MLIWNLALADSMVLLAVPFHIVEVLLPGWPFGQLLCNVHLFLNFLNHLSIFGLQENQAWMETLLSYLVSPSKRNSICLLHFI